MAIEIFTSSRRMIGTPSRYLSYSPHPAARYLGILDELCTVDRRGLYRACDTCAVNHVVSATPIIGRVCTQNQIWTSKGGSKSHLGTPANVLVHVGSRA